MEYILSLMVWFLLALAGIMPGTVQAQTDQPADLLVTAFDEQGIMQVYRINTTTNEVEQLTQAPANVEAYDISPNILAYISGTELYIKYADGVTVQNLERPDGIRVSVHISPDEQEISYSDESGLYIFNRTTGMAEKLLEHKDFLNPNNPNGVGDGRYYNEALFLADSDTLLIGISGWKSTTLGIYHRPSQTLTELLKGWNEADVPLQLFNRALPLVDGSILLHHYYNERGCLPCGLWQAPVIDDIASYEVLLDNAALTNHLDQNLISPGIPAGIPAMVQMPDGTVRLLVLYSFLDANQTFQNVSSVLEFTLGTNELSVIMNEFDPTIVPMIPEFSTDGRYLTEFSADGRYLAFVGGEIIGSELIEGTYVAVGQPVVYDVENGTRLDLDVPLEIYSIRWAE